MGVVTWFYRLFDRLPQRLGYDPTLSNGPATLHFWYRELFHLLGGLILGLVLGSRSRAVRRIGFAVLMLAIGAKEVPEVLGGQTWVKTVIDLGAWAIGFGLGAWALQRRSTLALPPEASIVNS